MEDLITDNRLWKQRTIDIGIAHIILQSFVFQSIFLRAVGPHSFFADPDPAVFLKVDPDPGGKMNADPDLA